MEVKNVLMGLRSAKEYSCGYGGTPNFYNLTESSKVYIFLVYSMSVFVTIKISSWTK